MSTFDPRQHVGTKVTFRGTAYDARAGAIVELDDRTPIYVAGLAEWEPALQGKPVEITGTLKERPARTPKVPPGGPQVHGLTGATFVVEDASWRAVG
ncbi:MAG TPA: hypothetical protein VM734_13480 [Kofleriaceae bacterium]|jgi:hypothetical protein|nr:hypothetical protein [Kofleriaceae bacterium]